jgi:diphthine-ammonia ligase
MLFLSRFFAPLFRSIFPGGSSVSTGLAYERTEGDEVEDLYQLLLSVKTALPEVTAVCSGAILSTYQRLRVEHVCSRLNLVSLAYLWEKDQSSLLAEMVNNSMDVILVKVASAGLSPRMHLGASLATLRPYLEKIGEQYGVNVCGEGGEYETLTLDCALFRSRIVIDETEVVGDVDSPVDLAPVGVLRIKRWHMEKKEGYEPIKACRSMKKTAVSTSKLPPLAVVAEQPQANAAPAGSSSISQLKSTSATQTPQWAASNVVGDYCYVAVPPAPAPSSAAQAASSGTELSPAPQAPDPNVAAGIAEMFARVRDALTERAFDIKDAFYVQLFLSQLSSDFAPANGEYKKHLPLTNAASRACVQLSGFHSASPLCADLIASRCPREVLHVQSISEWAPACIGPYSQATAAGPLIWLAGQIGLQPASMELHRGAENQLKASWMHCAQVLHTVKSRLSNAVSAVVFWKSDWWFAAENREKRNQLVKFCTEQIKRPKRVPKPAPRVFRNGRLVAAPATKKQEAAAPTCEQQGAVIHLAVPSLPRDALAEVQLICVPNAPEMHVKFISVREDCRATAEGGQEYAAAAAPNAGAAGLHCASHTTFVSRLFASEWSELSFGAAAAGTAEFRRNLDEAVLNLLKQARKNGIEKAKLR